MSDSHTGNGDGIRQFNYLAQHGQKLLENGYHIVPIRVGGKAPGFDGWEKSRATKQQLNEWLEGGHRMAGVGILTKNTPAVDLDIRDEEVAELMDAYVRRRLGGQMLRIGKAPKRLFLFRTDKPFRKMRSTMRTDDEWQQDHQVEVLGEGQQCVVYHKHPETGEPYYWPNGDYNPLNVPVSDLPTIDEEQIIAMIEYFEGLCDERGWKVKKKGRRNGSETIAADNPFVEDTAPVLMSDDELKSRLLLVPNADEYETWVQVGMALYHQFDGDDKGLEFWHEWAETADNYDHDALERRWKDFGIEGKKRAPITFRYILKMANEAVANTTEELTISLKDAFITAKDTKAWKEAAAKAKNAEIDGLARATLAGIAKEALDRITGMKTPLGEIKKALAFTPKNGEKTAGWAKEWVYDTSDDKFFATEKQIITSKQGFDAMFDRHALTKKDALDGKSTPSTNASSLALNVFKIPTVNGRRYSPGRDPIYHTNEGIFANTYTETDLPEKPEKLLPRDKRNVDRIKAHISHLLADPIEQRMFLDWLSWIVQNPGRHANYSILLQGVEGDGKSFWAELMRAVMGATNVQMLNAHIFESDFTDWTVGQCLSCVEEVRIVKALNKYEVINRIKPFITNKFIEVHPKGKPIYNAVNTTSYLLFSNFKDALPLDDDGRRFLVLFSRWQRKWQLDKFKAENPDYYVKLYNAIDDSAGAIRQFLLDHEQHEDFNATGDAPQTQARKFMVRQSKPEFIQVLDDVIAENETLEASDVLVNATALSHVFVGKGVEVPHTKTFHSMMQRSGWEELGKVRVDNSLAMFWSRDPDQFRSIDVNFDVRTDPTKIRRYLTERKDEIDDGEL